MSMTCRSLIRILATAAMPWAAPATASAWGLEIPHKDEMPDFVNMTRQSDFIGRWSYDVAFTAENSEEAKVVIDVDRCGDMLCVRRIMPSGSCSAPMMIVHEDSKIPRKMPEDEDSWRFSGKMKWIDGVQYDMLADVIDDRSRLDGKLPSRADQRLLFNGGPSSIGGHAWGGRAYPTGFTFKYTGAPTCAASS